jgi:hypothetical protein
MADGTVQNSGSIYVTSFSFAFSVHTLSFVPCKMCAFFSLLFIYLFGPSLRIAFGLVSGWGFLLLFGFFSGCSLRGFLGSVFDFYADAIHDIKMRMMSRCFFYDALSSQLAWFSTTASPRFMCFPRRLAFFPSAIIQP